jgi:hypothetical protein
MSLIECPDCLNRISDKAPACPHCGHPFHAAPAATPRHTPPQPVTVKETVMTRNRGCGDLLLILVAVGAAVIVGGCALMAGLSQ